MSLFGKMADVGFIDKENVGEKVENSFVKQDRRSESSQPDSKMGGDNEDAESVDEQPLDIGEHYLVRRSDGSWRKLDCMPQTLKPVMAYFIIFLSTFICDMKYINSGTAYCIFMYVFANCISIVSI